MDRAEYEALASVGKDVKPVQIFFSQFSLDGEDRTLLYGYDVNRTTHHVYLKDGIVHLVTYNYGEPVLTAQYEFVEFEDLIPNKRLYPEACDLDFCTWLKHKGIRLPFTTWDDERAEKREATGEKFYGQIFGDI